MNDAQLHLLLNHFPIVGTFFSLLTLLAGIISGSRAMKVTGYAMLVFVALLSIPVFLSGEGAEEIVEEQGISHAVIHDHEEWAEIAIWMMEGLGLLALIGLFVEIRRMRFAGGWSLIILVVALAVNASMAWVGKLGGEINHPELRAEDRAAGASDDHGADEHHEH